MKSATTTNSSANKQTRNGGLFSSGTTGQSSLNVQQTSISQVSKIYSSTYKGGPQGASNVKTAGFNSQTTLSQSPYTNGSTVYNQKFRKNGPGNTSGVMAMHTQGNSNLDDLPRQISSYSVDRVANTAIKPNFYPGSAEKYNGDLSFESNSLANNSFTLGQKNSMLMDFSAGQLPPDPAVVVDYPLRQPTYNAGFISIKHQVAK